MNQIDVVSLKSLIRKAPSVKAGQGNYQVLSMTMRDGLVEQANKFKKRVASQDLSGYKVVRFGQLVVGFPIDEGVLAVQDKLPHACVSPAYNIWNINQERVNPRFLHLFLRSERAISFYKAKLRGTTARRRTIPDDVFLQLDVPLPPLEEQKRIAEILDKASNLSSRLASAVQLEDEFNASLFDKLIGNPEVNAKGFPRVRLTDLCTSTDDIKCGPFGTQLKQHEFRSTGVPLWGIKHVNRRFEIPTSEFLEVDTATRLSTYSLESGDIVMTRKGTVGNCSVYPDRLPSGVIHSDLLRIRLDATRCLPSFAAYQLHHSTDIKRQIDLISGGAIMAGINVGKLKEVTIVVPDLDIQKEFESLVSRGSWLVWQKNQSLIMRSHELLQSLSSSFFLGSQSGQAKT